MSVLKIKDGKINFCCRQSECVHSCCGPFAGITSELSSLEHRPFDEIVLTKKDYEALYSAGYAHLIEQKHSKEMQKPYYTMALEADGTCKAFANGCCSIYSLRPTLCRAFPFYIDMFSGLCAIHCEGFSDEYWSDLSNYTPHFEAAKDMYRFWIDFYTGTKE